MILCRLADQKISRPFFFFLLFLLAAPKRCTRSAVHSVGDVASRLAIPRLVSYVLKKKLGLVFDREGLKESNCNTSLEYHAGDNNSNHVASRPFFLSLSLSSLSFVFFFAAFSMYGRVVDVRKTRLPRQTLGGADFCVKDKKVIM